MPCYTVKPNNFPEVNVISVYSPAWKLDTSKYKKEDVDKLYSPAREGGLRLTEVIQSCMENTNLTTIPWIVAGDFNSSETFDKNWQNEHNIHSGFCVE